MATCVKETWFHAWQLTRSNVLFTAVATQMLTCATTFFSIFWMKIQFNTFRHAKRLSRVIKVCSQTKSKKKQKNVNARNYTTKLKKSLKFVNKQYSRPKNKNEYRVSSEFNRLKKNYVEVPSQEDLWWQFIKNMLIEIVFVVKMRTTWGNKEVPQTFFHNYPYSQKYHLIRLTPYHWQLQPCISQFCDITNGMILQKFSQRRN